MTEPGPFAPPSGALPPRPAEPAVPPVPVPLPPPTGAPLATTPFGHPVGPPIAPPPPPRRGWILPVVIGGSLVALALIGVFVAVAIQLVSFVPPPPAAGPVGSPSTPDDLLEGDPGAPVAAEPLDCVLCLSVVDARALGLPDESYDAVGLTVGDNAPFEILAGADQIDQTKWWKADGGTPDACYFTYAKAPLFFEPGAIDDTAAANDPVVYSEWYSDETEYYWGTEAVRVFDDSTAASAYLAGLETAIAGCPNYAFPESGWSSVVTPAPAFDLPASVAGYGWVESGGLSRFYAADLQRGNLVARVTIWSDGGGPTEAEFRGLVEEYAALLAAIEPSL
jgi:hypothetical protein